MKNALVQRLRHASGFTAFVVVTLIPHGSLQAAVSEKGTWLQPQASADDAPRITEALKAGVVTLACGHYRLATPITVAGGSASALRGEDEACVQLDVSFDSAPEVSLSNTWRFTVESLTFNALATRHKGAVLLLSKSYGTDINHIAITGPQYDDIVMRRANTTRISFFDFRPLSKGDVIATAASGSCITIADGSVDTFVSQGNMGGCGTAGLHLVSASGVYLNDIDIILGGRSVLIDPTLSAHQSVSAVFANNVLGDTPEREAWALVGDGSITDVTLSNVWASSAGHGEEGGRANTAHAGFLLTNPAIDGVRFSNATAINNGAAGWDVQAGRNIGIAGSSAAEMNSTATPGQYDGIHIGATATTVRIESAYAGTGGSIAATVPGSRNGQRYGISVDDNNNSHQLVTLIGCQAVGNVKAAFMLPTPKSKSDIISIGNAGN